MKDRLAEGRPLVNVGLPEKVAARLFVGAFLLGVSIYGLGKDAQSMARKIRQGLHIRLNSNRFHS